MRRHIKLLVGAALFLPLVASLLMIRPAAALSGSDFQAGRIIDDGVFFNGNDMSAGQMQQFLNAKVPSCDTNGSGSKSYYYNSSTGRLGDSADTWVTTSRAVYGQRYNAYNGVGYADPPYYCLKDFHLDTPSRSPEPGLCNGYNGRNGQSSSEIIYDVAISCGVNPKALIVLLQKEQGLVTDEWPWDNQYQKATGFACPDTAPCDAQFFGFFNQVYSAARQFKKYAQSPGSFNYQANSNNAVRYNPNASCGSSTVFIQNQATAGLYNYTPYQPNAAALNGLSDSSPGGGDGCSAYGNRNFWWYFNRWFGSTTQFNGTVQLTSNLTISKQPNAYVNDTIGASYTVTNTASYPVDIGGLGICARLNGLHYDFGFQNMVSLPANGSTSISYSRKVDRPGVLNVFLCSYNDRAGGWAGDHYPYSAGQYARQATFEVWRNPVVTTGLSLSPANPTLHQNVTASFTVTNNSSSAVVIPAIGVAARNPSGANVGFAADSNVTIAANSTYTYSKTRTFTGNPGSYRFWITSFVGGVWDDTYPGTYTAAKSLTTPIHDNPAITTSLSLSPANPTVQQPVTASFTITNNSASPVNIPFIGVAARDPAGANVGFLGDSNVTIAANSTYTYSKTRTFTGSPGNYSFWVTSFVGGAWNDSYPAALPGITRNFTKKIYDNPLITTGLSLSPTNPTLNQSVTASFTITNNSSSAVVIPAIGVAARDGANANVGFASDTNVTIAANSTYTYSKTRTFTGNSGSFKFWITSFVNNNWNDNYPAAADGLVRQITQNIGP